MAENNLIMTIVLVVAATLLFTGGLTGNVPRSNFASAPSYINAGGEVICSEEVQGIFTTRGPALEATNYKCEKNIVDYCNPILSQPFIYAQVAPQRFEIRCRESVQLSTAQPSTSL